MSEEQIIDKVSMIDQWKVSGDSYTQGELDAIGQLLELYYDNKKQLEQEKEKISDLKYQLYHKQQMIDELTQNEENLKIELGKEKQKNKELEEHYKHEQEYINGEVFSAKQMHIIDEDYISKDKIKELLENEIIDISGFRCIAVEDIENLLEEK